MMKQRKNTLFLMRPLNHVRVVFFALLICLSHGCSHAEKKTQSRPLTDPQDWPMWVEIGPDTTLTARAIVEADRCPTIKIDAQEISMDTRAPAEAGRYPVLTCEKILPATTTHASISGRALPLPKKDLTKIVVIGDTGCRIAGKGSDTRVQACNDPTKWTFPVVAKAIADAQPDLVIHVGDYLYREVPCPADQPGCAKSPSGDRWATWDADFFSPADPLLRVAPWIFVRGNHELCARAGAGWFRFLDARALSQACSDETPPYLVHTGDHGPEFLITDSAPGPLTQKSLAALAELSPHHAWLFTHRPIWFPSAKGKPDLSMGPHLIPPHGIDLVFAGHVHSFRIIDFKKPRVPEIIAGNSGTQLTPLDDALAAEFTKNKMPVRSVCGENDFGFLTLERSAPLKNTKWKVFETPLASLENHTLSSCRLEY